MKRTAYDILGVPSTATQEEIAAAYDALRITLDPQAPANHANPDAELQYKVLQESHYLIGDPVRRGAYDATLGRGSVLADIEPLGESLEQGRRKFLIGALMVVVLLGFGLNYLYQQKRADYDRERQRIIEAERAEQEAANSGANASAEEWRQRNAEERVRAEMEAARREGARIHTQLQYEEEAARRRQEWERQRQEQQERMEQANAEREAAIRRNQERYRANSMDRSGGGVVAVPYSGRPVIDQPGR